MTKPTEWFVCPVKTQISLADAQSDLSLRWVHGSFCWFCHAAAHLFLNEVSRYSHAVEETIATGDNHFDWAEHYPVTGTCPLFSETENDGIWW